MPITQVSQKAPADSVFGQRPKRPSLPFGKICVTDTLAKCDLVRVVSVFMVLLLAIGTLISCESANRKAEPVKPQSPGSLLGRSTWITGNKLRLKTKIYESAKLSGHRLLIVVLHGDLLEPNVRPTYHYEFARKAAERTNDVIAAGLLRPGYTDGDGDQSAGRRGLATGDNFTPEDVDAVADGVRELQAKFHPSATVMVGHSGGAAIIGNLLGRRPPEIHAALLVSCPCDVPSWRRYMVKAQFTKVGPFSLLFLLPVKSLSPLDFANQVSPSVRIRMIVGSRDSSAPPRFTHEYARALRGYGVNTTVTVGQGLEHNILLDDIVFDQLMDLLAETRQTVRY
jgi:pimeloyl-ACP methyl ester carboxylesterase